MSDHFETPCTSSTTSHGIES